MSRDAKLDFFEKKEDSEVLLEISLYNKVAEVVGVGYNNYSYS